MYIAHKRDDGKNQPIIEHLRKTAKLASEFAESFNSSRMAYLCGIMHDIGKYSNKFQKRISEGGHLVDHSTAGAKELSREFKRTGFLLAYCVAGHHTGLPDGGSLADTQDEPTLRGRLKKNIENCDKYKEEIDLSELSRQPALLPIRPLGRPGFSVSFYIRMLFSCLVDADFLDTEDFMSGGKRPKAGESMDKLVSKLDEYIKSFDNPTKEINKKRTDILNCCIQKAVCGKGLYTLTVPTGGGKTVSSLAFALKHAICHKMSRIIYVIPYNSIIEQNAAKFKEILGEENVLEHHSNFAYDDTSELLKMQRLATENWDMPVIVTTNVQFFESLFSNRTSKCRKLHNIANSVIIFDEAQMLPTQYLLPCVRAISELVSNYGCTAVLCSATQPALGKLFPKELQIRELCERTEEYYAFFNKTKFVHIGEIEDAHLAERLNSEKQVLCIVNTRKHAQNIFNLLKGEESCHLSTLMYPKHRTKVLNEIRKRLSEGLPCRVVSTSLIEAGVDVNFPVLYRAEAGLDSEIQAAGRCNREREMAEAPVYIFRPTEEYRRHMPSMLKRPTEITLSIASRFQDIASPDAIFAYFSELYGYEGEGLDCKNIVKSFEDGFENDFNFPFAEVGSEFKLIENPTRSIIIAREDECKELVKRLQNGERNIQLLRLVQQYTVNVYPFEYDALYKTGSIEPLDGEIAVLVDEERYSEKTGLDVGADGGVGIFA